MFSRKFPRRQTLKLKTDRLIFERAMIVHTQNSAVPEK